ncbi:uncharacterized protein LOC143267459 [Peromyscus maniculatus bairdii]|uniref:uncharacterized protein LOC143267459 n=1 Tax=Peromyscus maniculatus bairdii TaxID=230844 RepID=UPI003FD35365
MWSRLRRLVERENTQHGETRARKKEAGPRSHWKTFFFFFFFWFFETGFLCVALCLSWISLCRPGWPYLPETTVQSFEEFAIQAEHVASSSIQDCQEIHEWTTAVSPSQLSTITEQEQQLKNIEKLTICLHDMECERNELRGILANYTNKDLNNRLNFEIAMLEIEHKQVMSSLHKLPMEISDALDKCKGLIEETEYFR